MATADHSGTKESGAGGQAGGVGAAGPSVRGAIAGEKYTIRRKVFRFLGAGFTIFGPDGSQIGYCHQRAFRLREDLRVYTDESKSQELLRIRTPQVIDFSARYEVQLPDGAKIGTIQRKGMKSLLRDTWLVFDASDAEVATLQEDSAFRAIVRRVANDIAFLMPQKFQLTRSDGQNLALLRQHFNPFVYRLGITINDPDDVVDDLVILALGCLVCAIEGRQG